MKDERVENMEREKEEWESDGEVDHQLEKVLLKE